MSERIDQRNALHLAVNIIQRFRAASLTSLVVSAFSPYSHASSQSILNQEPLFLTLAEGQRDDSVLP